MSHLPISPYKPSQPSLGLSLPPLEVPKVRADWLEVLPLACDVLRDYQRMQLDAVSVALGDGVRRILVQMHTGGGKTHEIAAVVLAAVLAGLRVLILATRTRLVNQLRQRLDAFGVQYGVIAARLPGLTNAGMAVQVASVDTLYRRCLVNGRRPLPAADVVIFDEAHLSTAQSRMAVLDKYPDAVLLGFTATPARKSGRSLGAVFQMLIAGPTIAELIDKGMLVRPRIFNTPIVSLDELKSLPRDTANDYAVAALVELLSRPKLIGDVVSNWLRIANGQRTLVFAVNKGHAAQLTEEFCRVGVAAEFLTDQNDEAEREEVIARLESGRTTVVVNCFLMSYGVDIPTVECIVLARPTRSLVMFLQMVGRGLRPAAGKKQCLVIDHGRVVENLGLPTSDFKWSLDDKRNVNLEAAAAGNCDSGIEKPRTCAECENMWLVSESGDSCDLCGWRPAPRAKLVLTENADLAEMDGTSTKIEIGSPDVTQFYREAIYRYARRWPDRWQQTPQTGRWWGWKNTCKKFGFRDKPVPDFVWSAMPREITQATVGWLKSRDIAWAKRRRSQS